MSKGILRWASSLAGIRLATLVGGHLRFVKQDTGVHAKYHRNRASFLKLRALFSGRFPYDLHAECVLS